MDWAASNGVVKPFAIGNIQEASTTLPVELVYFKGGLTDESVMLNWQTASELNNEDFQVEHCLDSRNWERIDFIPGHGTSVEVQNYSYIHKRPAFGLNYYRLRACFNFHDCAKAGKFCSEQDIFCPE